MVELFRKKGYWLRKKSTSVFHNLDNILNEIFKQKNKNNIFNNPFKSQIYVNRRFYVKTQHV